MHVKRRTTLTHTSIWFVIINSASLMARQIALELLMMNRGSARETRRATRDESTNRDRELLTTYVWLFVQHNENPSPCRTFYIISSSTIFLIILRWILFNCNRFIDIEPWLRCHPHRRRRRRRHSHGIHLAALFEHVWLVYLQQGIGATVNRFNCWLIWFVRITGFPYLCECVCGSCVWQCPAQTHNRHSPPS